MSFDHYLHFLKTIIETLSPHHYKIIASRKKRYVIAYFYSLIFFALFISMIISLPKFIYLPNTIDDVLSKFDTLNIDVTVKTNQSIALPEKDPILIIDSEQKANRSTESFFIDSEGIVIKTYLLGHKSINWNTAGDLLKKKEKVKQIVYIIFLLSLPIILFILFILYSIKYTLILAISVVIGYLIGKSLQLKVKFTRVIRIMGFASTWIIIPEMLIMPFFFQKYLFPIPFLFGTKIYLIPYTIFIVYTFLAFFTISGYRHDKFSR